MNFGILFLGALVGLISGALAKTGSKPIAGVLDYGRPPTGAGLWFMDAPAPALENLNALAAAGCQVILFSSGSANPVGHPLAPTVKVVANTTAVRRMGEHILCQAVCPVERLAGVSPCLTRSIQSKTARLYMRL